jgi:hypothetical protein
MQVNLLPETARETTAYIQRARHGHLNFDDRLRSHTASARTAAERQAGGKHHPSLTSVLDTGLHNGGLTLY